jgi:hypothetical protein
MEPAESGATWMGKPKAEIMGMSESTATVSPVQRATQAKGGWRTRETSVAALRVNGAAGRRATWMAEPTGRTNGCE